MTATTSASHITPVECVAIIVTAAVVRATSLGRSGCSTRPSPAAHSRQPAAYPTPLGLATVVL